MKGTTTVAALLLLAVLANGQGFNILPQSFYDQMSRLSKLSQTFSQVGTEEVAQAIANGTASVINNQSSISIVNGVMKLVAQGVDASGNTYKIIRKESDGIRDYFERRCNPKTKTCTESKYTMDLKNSDGIPDWHNSTVPMQDIINNNNQQ